MINRTGVLSLAGALIFSLIIVSTASAGVISESTAKITQLKIIHLGQGNQIAPSQPDAWGISSDRIGPGDIRKLIGVEVYIDAEQRISAVKVTRESYTGDMVTSIFTGVVEFSIQVLKEGANRPHKVAPITILTADSITFP